jgi:membrane peptidoglycan carboxypeptidase
MEYGSVTFFLRCNERARVQMTQLLIRSSERMFYALLRPLCIAIATRVTIQRFNELQTVIAALTHKLSTESTYRIPDTVQQVLIAAEDHRFFRHIGFDIIAILRAFLKFLLFRRIEGASTITQQLVRTCLHEYGLSPIRKIREIGMAILLEDIMPKQEIPRLYLHCAYYGWHMNGYTQACVRLGINPSEVSSQKACMLVARLKYPEPKNLSKARRYKIENREGYLFTKVDNLLNGE